MTNSTRKLKSTIYEIIFRWWMIYRNVPDGPRCVDMLINTVSIRLDSYSVIGLTWAMALALALPPLLGWNHYAPESNGIR